MPSDNGPRRALAVVGYVYQCTRCGALIQHAVTDGTLIHGCGGTNG